jgi:hypothetical protein
MTQFHGILNGEPLSEKAKEARRKNFAAFPVQRYDGSWIDGMALRDYFAAKAMKRVTFAGHPRIKEPDEGWMLRDAKICYEIADAMMKAREL